MKQDTKENMLAYVGTMALALFISLAAAAAIIIVVDIINTAL